MLQLAVHVSVINTHHILNFGPLRGETT